MSLMTKPSKEYNELVEEYKNLHTDTTIFPGKSVVKYAHYIRSIVRDNKCKTLLDYGCGKGYLYEPNNPYAEEKLGKTLQDFLNISKVTCYDPGVEKFSKLPDERSDLVIAVDVMEHIPAQDLEWVVDTILSYADKAAFFNIACYEALKTFSDGKNVHVTVEKPNWWVDLIKKIWHDKHRSRVTAHITFEEVEERFLSTGVFKTHVFYSC